MVDLAVDVSRETDRGAGKFVEPRIGRYYILGAARDRDLRVRIVGIDRSEWEPIAKRIAVCGEIRDGAV